MLEIVRSGQFKRDVKLAGKRGRDLDKLRHVLELLVAGKPLPARYHDHPLKGDWAGFRDLHLGPDWLLIIGCKARHWNWRVPVATAIFSKASAKVNLADPGRFRYRLRPAGA